MKRIVTATFVVLIAITGLTGPAYAQSGKITGIVRDKNSREPLIGANIVVEGTLLGATTDLDGTFVILRVPPGKYNLNVSYIGYQNTILQNVEVLTDLTTNVEIQLQEEAIAGQEVVVVAEQPLVRKDLTSVEARVQAEEIGRMPVQELGDVLNLQAGVTRDAGGGIHIRGGRSTEVSYLVNGISITDDFTRTQSFQIENESIQELQVISGTFNAEYGNAMSGVINVVTKTGGNRLTGGLEAWSGDYLSSRDELFFNIDELSPGDIYNIQGSLSGPLIRNKLSFFLTGRRWYSDGWLYGANRYLPQGRYRTVVENADTTIVPNPGDSSAVSMNFRDRYSFQGSLEWQVANSLKFRVDGLGSTEERRNYDHFFKLNPTGDRGDKERGGSIIANLTHVLSLKTFHEATVAVKYNELTSNLYEDPFDQRYVHPDSLNTGQFQFARAGTDLSRFERFTASAIFKYDLSSQIHKRHFIKTGLEYQRDRVFFKDITLVPAEDETGQQIVPFRPAIRDISSPVHNEFTRRPEKFAAYIQDKIEYETLIINVGVRFDRFDANGQVPNDPADPNIFNPLKLSNIYRDSNGDGVISVDEQNDANRLTVAEREQYWWRETSVKTQISPRLGVAYPITEQGVIHFSYGIFQQIPDYGQLYVGDQLKITSGSGTKGPFGNPDLNPQRTTMYELGLKQELTENLAIDVTGFYRDIRDWISTTQPINTVRDDIDYVITTNRDFANVRGITLAVSRRLANGFSLDVDYTFQVAEGTNSDPAQEFFSQQGGAEPTRILTPLNWDQKHTLNANIFVGGKDWGASVITRFNSGQPYTPDFIPGTRTGQNILSGLRENSRRKPDIFSVDFTASKNLRISNLDVQLFLRIFNLLDLDNPVNVFGDTGLADFTLREGRSTGADPTWFKQPHLFSEPRRIQVGTRINFR